MVIYFSGTGNSAYAAEAIADCLQDEAVCANTYMKEGRKGDFRSESPWVFVFPVYISAMAEIFADFLRKSEFSGNRNAYFVATCAAAMGVSPDIGNAICKAKGLTFMGAEQIVMPQNYIALFRMTPPEEIASRQKNALEAARSIAKTVAEGGKLKTELKSHAEVVMSHWIEELYNGCFTGTGKFTATDKCISCGTCARVCPLNNVKLTDGKPQWGKNCVHCMACINRCPKSAIEYGKGTADKKRYVCVKYRSASKDPRTGEDRT